MGRLDGKVALITGAARGQGEAALGSTGLRRRFASRPNAPACVVRPTQTEGPYFVDERLNRRDIRSAAER